MDVAGIRRVLPDHDTLDPNGSLEVLPPFGPVGSALLIADLDACGYTVVAERCDHPPFTHLVRMQPDDATCPDEAVWYLVSFA